MLGSSGAPTRGLYPLRASVASPGAAVEGRPSRPLTYNETDEGSRRARGREFVRHLDRKRIFADLAHINREGFFDAVEVHDKSQPLLVTHTGVDGVHPHWRNLDDEQLRAVADTGGTVGVIYRSSDLGPKGEGGRGFEGRLSRDRRRPDARGPAGSPARGRR